MLLEERIEILFTEVGTYIRNGIFLKISIYNFFRIFLKIYI